MTARKSIGIAMTVAPFVGVFVFGVWQIGLLPALALFAGVALFVVWTTIAVNLMEGDA